MPNPSAKSPAARAEKIFALLLGTFLGLAFLKFGNPAVMQKFVESPTQPIEWWVFAWPLQVAYPLFGILLLAAWPALRFRAFAPRWLLIAPLAWFGWQLVSATQSVDGTLSGSVLGYFAVCVTCFFLGGLGAGRREVLPFLLGPLLVAFAGMIYSGFTQHFGGLQQTRDYFWTYVYPTLPGVPPEYLKKMQSNRIFATVFYPNAFAGALLLLTPPLLAWIWQAKHKFTAGARGLLCGMVGGSAAACLFWSGSKGGWLLALLLGFVALLHQDFPRKYKVSLIVLLIAAGGAGFYWKNRAYLERGATSVVARFDYWQAAGQTVWGKPVFGSGPGTFGVAYEAIKKPESEMARLTHNDYLQQASDSGFPGFITYVVFVGGMLWLGYRRLDWQQAPVLCGIWLGVAAWAVQSAFEFALYVPPLAWTAFALGGWLLGSTRETIRQNLSNTPTLPTR